MTQQIIDIGADANDGTGEPLRQAFQAVNDNFSNIWAAGPVDSQVVISNNVVSTNVTNLDLVLAGNGIGNVTVASTVVPNIDSVYDLGNINSQFDTVWARYYRGNGAFLTGIESGGSGGNVYFGSTPPLNPKIGDIWIDSDTAVQYLYFNDNSGNVWAEMEAYQSFGSGPLSGNGVPGGANTQIQFNSNGDFGASANLIFDSVTSQLQIIGNVVSNVVVTSEISSGNSNALINAAGNVWVFSSSGTLTLPSATVVSTPADPDFANKTQKTLSGSIETVSGNPVPSYTTALSQTETIWTATQSTVTAARMTLRIQYGSAPVTGMELCDITLAKEWGTNANVSYVISNRIRTNNSLAYANVMANIDGSNNLIVTVTNTSGASEYYSYSVTEFGVTND